MKKEHHQKKTTANQRPKKLKLNKETIKDLEPQEPSQLKAGAAKTGSNCDTNLDCLTREAWCH